MQVEARSKELQKLGVGVKIVCVGKKGSSYFKRRLDRFTVSGAALAFLGFRGSTEP